MLFSVLYGFWAASNTAFDGNMRDLASAVPTLAEKHGSPGPLMLGHRLMGASLVCTGDPTIGRTHLDQALALYDPEQASPLSDATWPRPRVAILSYRSLALWMLGYPESALADVERALSEAREIGHAATMMYALFYAAVAASLLRRLRRSRSGGERNRCIGG